MKTRVLSLLALLLVLCLAFTSCDALTDLLGGFGGGQETPPANATLDNIPAYSGSPFVIIDNHQPSFTEDEIVTKSYEYYSPLDSLGRCGYTMACIGLDTMPEEGEERESISSVKPTGWVNKEYDFVDGEYLYNRAHLIGWQLTAENANRQNLITGTRYMNVQGMLPFENMVARYVKDYENHVMYRVTPIFVGNELVARGVQMEAWSVEDDGEGICFNVYVYNVQPGVEIDYATGNNWLSDEEPPKADLPAGGNEGGEDSEVADYILNTNTKRFHLPSCSSVDDMKESNKQEYRGSRAALIADGYRACGSCNP